MNIPENLDRESCEKLIDNWIFDEKDRQMLKRRLLDGITLEQLAEEFNYSVSGIKKRINKCQDKFFRRIDRL